MLGRFDPFGDTDGFLSEMEQYAAIGVDHIHMSGPAPRSRRLDHRVRREGRAAAERHRRIEPRDRGANVGDSQRGALRIPHLIQRPTAPLSERPVNTGPMAVAATPRAQHS